MKRVRLCSLAGYGIIDLFGVEGFVLSFSTNPQMFQARYAEVILHIRNYAEKLPHSDCCAFDKGTEDHTRCQVLLMQHLPNSFAKR